MKKSKFSKKEISELFSRGEFEITSIYLSDDVIWSIVGEKELKGKTEVMSYCKKTTEYFNSVQTKFIIKDTIEDDKKVVIRGTGEFIKNGKTVNTITACDIYEFNDKNELIKIISYCIPGIN